MLIAAARGSATCQNTIASTPTATVSRVNACSAVIVVVSTRMSTMNATRSISGNSRNRPGPRTPANRPSRSTTARFHSEVMRTDRNRTNTIITAMAMPTARKGFCWIIFEQ